MLGSLILFLGATAGNTALGAWIINQIYGTRFRGWWVTLIRVTCQALIVVFPLAFAVGFGPAIWRESDWIMSAGWLKLPPALLAYLMVCWGLGFVVVPAVTLQRWLRRAPVQLLDNHTTTLRVGEVLGRKPLGPSKHGWLARLPRNQIWDVDFVELTLALSRLPRELDGLSIWHISDTHLCGCPDYAFYEHVFDRCAEQPADIVVVTGDILDSDRHYHWIVPLFSKLQGRFASLGILGNHDAWLEVPEIVSRMQRSGFTMLGGRWLEIPVRGRQIVVIGNEMPWLRPAPDLSNCPPHPFRLCLSHSPDTIGWARNHGVDLVLAGHNHGGQVRFPLIGPLLVPSRLSRRYDCGTFFEPPTLLHVSRGLAGTYPLRWNCRPEVTRLVLRSQT
ncbi:MAG: metallophosphoesterase [Gemmatales bacterium]|nr:metallophosphoesterase [Gemmatales bacterium]MDW8387150.1 metallophosphoesterase [Gemmatales bacterium]